MTQYFILTLDSDLGPNAARKIIQDAVKSVLTDAEDLSVKNLRRVIAKGGLHDLIRENVQ